MDAADQQDMPDLDNLDFQPFPGVDTLYKAMMYNLERFPSQDMIGMRMGEKY